MTRTSIPRRAAIVSATPVRSGGESAKNAPEDLRRRMMAAGDHLLAAISIETKWTTRLSKKPNSRDAMEGWRDSRRNVELFAAEYLRSIAQYRAAMENCAPAASAVDKT